MVSDVALLSLRSFPPRSMFLRLNKVRIRLLTKIHKRQEYASTNSKNTKTFNKISTWRRNWILEQNRKLSRELALIGCEAAPGGRAGCPSSPLLLCRPRYNSIVHYTSERHLVDIPTREVQKRERRHRPPLYLRMKTERRGGDESMSNNEVRNGLVWGQ